MDVAISPAAPLGFKGCRLQACRYYASFLQGLGILAQSAEAVAFALVNEHSYLYANALDTTLVFEGNARNAAAPAEIHLSYHASTNNQAGCNLVGNPFPFNAFADRSYYVLN